MSNSESKRQVWRRWLALPRAEGVTDTHIALGFAARFYDELAGGLPDVLLPTIQAQLGLSLTQLSLLKQAMEYIGVVVEPVNGLLIDLWPRKWLMGFGAAMLGLSIIIIGLAPTFW
jgi:MFS family permease